MAFDGLGALVVYAVQRLQAWLPLNPQGPANISADSAFDTAVSFVTNTNGQAYAGESTMSYLTQMAAPAVQNFLSAATGIAAALALMRGFARGQAAGIGPRCGAEAGACPHRAAAVGDIRRSTGQCTRAQSRLGHAR